MLNLRRILIAEKIEEIKEKIEEKKSKREDMEEVMNYTQLRKLLFDKLHRVV